MSCTSSAPAPQRISFIAGRCGRTDRRESKIRVWAYQRPRTRLLVTTCLKGPGIEFEGPFD